MTLKRIGSLKNKKHKHCLQCGFVDIYGTTLVLTAAERPDLRHRTKPKNQDNQEVVQKKKNQDEFNKRLVIFRNKWGR